MNITMRYLLILVILAFVIIFVSACRRSVPKPDGLPPLYPCEIEVTFSGEAIPGVGVLLRATDPKMKRWGAGGVTDKDGKVRPKTANAFSGVAQGEYIVSFSKRVSVEGAPMGDETSLIPVQYERKNSQIIIAIDPNHSYFRLQLEGVAKQQ